MKFSSLPLSQPILDAVAKKGYEHSSPIQEKAIPPILDGCDVMAAAQTGTGKTAGFTLPILEKLNAGLINGTQVKSNHVRALVITPTRELAAQVEESVKTYGSSLPLRSTVVFGGVKINPQMMKLRKGVDILVATPGRLLDLHQQNAIKFNQLEVLVLDEADRMLDMGFIHDIKKILKLLPSKRQNLLFSATFSDDIRSLAKGIVKDPIEISVTPPNTTANTVKQVLHPVDKSKKAQLLASLIKNNDWEQILVFTRTKHGANRLAKILEEKGITALAIHGNKSQGARTKALSGFKALKVRVLVATDIAARGLDISQLPHVVNFDLPNVPEDYVHRIGRTGRAGASGEAVSLVSADEIKQLTDIERLINKFIPREYVDGFEPKHEVPESSPLMLSRSAKKPKKPKKKQGDAPAAQKKRNSKEKSNNRPKTNNKAKTKGSSKKNGPVAKKEANGMSSPKRRRKPRAGSKTASSRRAQGKKDS